VAWVDLASVSDPADVPYRFLDALGLPEPADAPVDDFLADALCGGTCLTAVDNCEHVIEAAAGLLEKITMRAAGVALVATSREPLGIAGERVVVVPPLPTPERIGGDGAVLAPSVSLFLDRYRAAGGPALGPGALELVAEVCRRLDGLPLAVELAAARARSLGVAAMAERPLLDLLTGGRRGGAPRHRSLRAVLDWSHDLLDPHERVLLRRLSVFRGPFTLADAEAVCAGGGLAPDRVPAALAALVERSMVAGPGPEGDYRLLETVRAYGAEQLAAHGEDLRTGAAHARYLVEFAEQAAAGMRTADEPVWVGLVSARVEELRGAFRWACDHDADLAVRLAAALTTYARLQMRFEMQDWAATAADLPGAAGHPLLPVVLASAAAAAWARGDFARAEHLARRGLEEAHDGPTAAAPLLILGDVALLAGRFADADRAYQQPLAGAAMPTRTCAPRCSAVARPSPATRATWRVPGDCPGPAWRRPSTHRRACGPSRCTSPPRAS
jgi:predicted ATPase